MEIRKGSLPPAIQNEGTTESNKLTNASQPQNLESISDSLESAGPLNTFQQIEGQGLIDPGSIPDNVEEPGKLQDFMLGKQGIKVNLERSRENPESSDESTARPIPQFIANTEQLEIKQRLQDALDSTLAIRMKEGGSSASEIAQALASQGQSADEVANTLKELGFNGEETAVALRDAFQQAPSEIAATMKDAGFDATEIAKGLKEAWMQDPGQVRDILEALGFTQGEIASAMWGAFQIGEYTQL